MIVATGAITAMLAGCGNGSSSGSGTSSTTSTTSTTVGEIRPPVVITPAMSLEADDEPIPTIRVGDTIAFAMGTIAEGEEIVAVSGDPNLFLVTSKGTNNGTVVINAGGRARAAGRVDVELHRFRGTADTPLGTFRLIIAI